MCLLDICISSLQKYVFKSSAIFSFFLFFTRVLYIFRMQISCRIHGLLILCLILWVICSLSCFTSFEAHRILLWLLWRLTRCFLLFVLSQPFLELVFMFGKKVIPVHSYVCEYHPRDSAFYLLHCCSIGSKALLHFSLAMSWEHLHLGTVVFLLLL